jgi:glutathione S-transferase
MKLYVGPLSLFSAKARIALAEKGVEPQLVSVAWSRADRYEPHHPDVVALNPKHRVPVLVDGDLVVYDSTQIFEYLEERIPEPALYPRDLAGRARCRRLEAAADEIWFPRVWDLIEERFYAGGPRNSERAEVAAAGLNDLTRELEKALVGREFLVDAFSVADIATWIQVNAAAALGAPVPDECSAVGLWHQRVAARPAVAPVLADLTQAAARAMRS